MERREKEGRGQQQQQQRESANFKRRFSIPELPDFDINFHESGKQWLETTAANCCSYYLSRIETHSLIFEEILMKFFASLQQMPAAQLKRIKSAEFSIFHCQNKFSDIKPFALSFCKFKLETFIFLPPKSQSC